MVKWEYCAVSVTQLYDGWKTELLIWESGGERAEKVDSFGATVARLGRDGWEMVSHSVMGKSMRVDSHLIGAERVATGVVVDRNYELYVFKRPLSD